MHTALSLKVITPAHMVSTSICIVSFDSRNVLNEKT